MPPRKPNFRLFIISTAIGWSAFLVLRLGLMFARCARLPEVSVVDATLLEVLDHLAAALASVFVWWYMVRRRLVDLGWLRAVLEGFAVALFLNTIITVACFHPYSVIYRSDKDPFGVYEASILHYMSTPLWFGCVLAFVYWDHNCGLQAQRAEALDAARKAQLHTLRGQINPHFLFNSFNSLRALMSTSPSSATEAITHLSDILRYTLTCTDEMFVPLTREINVVTQYLDLEKLRLGARLEVQTSIDSDLTGIMVPPLIVQGLVENAVKYGPSALKRGGSVSYRIARDGDRLHIIVINTGRLATVSGSTGMGLTNLRNRLKLLFGDQASFVLHEESGPRVVAEVFLPLSRSLSS